MEANELKLVKCIDGDNTLIIPVYQRNYNWRKDNCETLFHDLEKIIANDTPHFLGTFVCKAKSRDSDEFIIIDGQQRIASVILLARALYDFVDPSIKEDIFATFIRNSKGELKGKLKLKPTEFDIEVFTKLMDENFRENNFNETEKNSSMYVNYKFFQQRIPESCYSAKEIYRAISRLKIVRILLHDENPQEIFESLNSTGLDLSNSDLIRNFLLMSLDGDAQEFLYKTYWLQIERLLKSADAVESFMIQYLITKRRSNSIQQNRKSLQLSKKILYQSFKKYFEEKYNGDNRTDEVKKFLEDAYRYAKIYSKCVFDEDTKFDELSALEKKFYELTFLLDAVNAPIILMFLYDRYENKNFDEKTFIKFVDALISLAFRAKVCKLGVIAAQFAGNVIARLDKKDFLTEELFWQTLTFGKGTYTFPSDEEFKRALTNSEAYLNLKLDGCKYFLYSLEKIFAAQDKNFPKYADMTVEHVLPQRLNKDWKSYLQGKNDLQAHENWRETLGNLILVGSNEKSVSGAEFQKKKDSAKNSAFQYTKDLEKYSEWTSKQIQARAKKLSGAAVKLWILPEEYQRSNEPIETIFNLDSEFEFFTGKKPATVSIFDVEKKISTWRAFQTEFASQLYALDSETFRLAAQKFDDSRNRKLFSTIAENLITAFKIDEDFFIETTLSTVQNLKFIKSFVEIFDDISGTNFKEDIWFTLRK